MAVSTSMAGLKEFQGLRASGPVHPSPASKSLLGAKASPAAQTRVAGGLSVHAVAVPVTPPGTLPAKRSKVEVFKEESNFLRYPLIDELKNDLPNVGAVSEQLIKFHGSYQQDDREARQGGGGRAWQFMMRTRQPGGKVDNRQYLTMDSLADQYGNGSLRLTTRQTFQLHGVLKENLKTVFSSVIRNMGSTLGACGDLNRNVLAPAVPFKARKDYEACQEYADKIALLFAPQAGAYYDVWLDGEKVFTAEEPEDVVKARMDNSFGTNFEGSPEPIYGTQFLPRKFKMAITVPGDNSVDLLTNDVGLVVMCDEEQNVQGFNIYVGGGMGRSHRSEETEPLLAVPLGYVDKADVLYALKAIIATQRDYGRRDDRKQARMKYLIRDWGIDKFRTVAEQYFGKSFQEFKPLPEWNFDPFLGWGEQGDGRLYYGLHVENGRLKGEAKKALRQVIEQYGIPVRISANQNLILCDVRKAWKPRITQALAAAGLVGKAYIDPLNITAMACPALPLCGLAIAEAERGLPDVLKRIRAMLDKVGLKKQSDTLVVRMTGCPNGCARPYMAELGFVGDGANAYQLWLGGTPNQTHLAQLFMERVKVQDLEQVLVPLFAAWKAGRRPQESFGEFTTRTGFEALKQRIEDHKRNPVISGGPRVRRGPKARISVDDALATKLQAIAKDQGLTTTRLIATIVEEYLEKAKQ